MTYLSVHHLYIHSKSIDVRRDNNARKSVSNKNTVFLSHSHIDADIIKPTINFLISIGVNVYVDWLDEDMPQITSEETATKIKRKIADCTRFIVLLTENSKESKWVPWELGYADGVKPIEHIAILPVRRSTSDSAFYGLEYMGLYPVIQEGELNGATIPAIFPPARIGGTGRSLGSGWLDSDRVRF